MSSSTSQKSASHESKLSLLDYMDEGRFTDWLALHGKNIIYGLSALLIVLAVVYYLSNTLMTKSEEDYVQAAQDFTVFVQATGTEDASTKNEAYSRLKSLMSTHPELHAAYDGTLAQTFLNRDLVADAKPYITATLSRTQSDALPLYAEFASTTLMISEHHYREALDKAQALQITMTEAIASQVNEAERGFGAELFALNLLRIAMLQQQTGDTKGELATWHHWKQYARLEAVSGPSANVDPQAFRAVIQRLAVGATSIPDYIAHREKLLQNN
ncbi:MAG: hypothetical protein WCF65_08350 [Parachlamydiaceae bacterium]